jgi:hypothetical protein
LKNEATDLIENKGPMLGKDQERSHRFGGEGSWQEAVGRREQIRKAVARQADG